MKKKKTTKIKSEQVSLMLSIVVVVAMVVVKELMTDRLMGHKVEWVDQDETEVTGVFHGKSVSTKPIESKVDQVLGDRDPGVKKAY